MTLQDCYHCGYPETQCDCDSLPSNFCKVCGREFKGKHYFCWAIHQAVCSYDAEVKHEKQAIQANPAQE